MDLDNTVAEEAVGPLEGNVWCHMGQLQDTDWLLVWASPTLKPQKTTTVTDKIKECWEDHMTNPKLNPLVDVTCCSPHLTWLWTSASAGSQWPSIWQVTWLSCGPGHCSTPSPAHLEPFQSLPPLQCMIHRAWENSGSVSPKFTIVCWASVCIYIRKEQLVGQFKLN